MGFNVSTFHQVKSNNPAIKHNVHFFIFSIFPSLTICDSNCGLLFHYFSHLFNSGQISRIDTDHMVADPLQL